MIDFGYGVRLLPLEEKNLKIYQAWRNNSEIRRWCRQYTLLSDRDQASWFLRAHEDDSIQMYEVHTEDSLVGVCGLTSIDYHNRRAEFSLYVGPQFQKRGHAKKALKTLFTHGFNDLNLHVIWGETFSENHASKLFEDIGMTREGCRRDFYFKNGSYIDAILYSIKASEWNT